MFRIRRVFDDTLPRDRQAIAQVQEMLKAQFDAVRAKEYEDIPAKLRDPLAFRFRTILYVAERGYSVRGFAILLHVTDVNFCYLDWLCASPGGTGRGVGGALYAHLREQARLLGACGIFFECPSDDPAVCRNHGLLRANRARMRFYERFGARPVVGTAYETPLSPTDDCPPSLLFDDLSGGGAGGEAGVGARKPGASGKPSGQRGRTVSAARAREVVRAILERKYGDTCPPEYVDLVVRSFAGPMRLREPRYAAPAAPSAPLVPVVPAVPAVPAAPRIALTVNDRHDIHHVHERGYVESPARVRSILKALEPTGLFERIDVRRHPERHVLAVHDAGMVRYFKAVTALLAPGKSVYPYVFPIRNQARPPKELPVRAGYYCIDTFTPLNSNAWQAARRAVDCVLTAADRVLDGERLAYALVRPPGHHAERRAFGGFCYFNAAAVAAQYCLERGLSAPGAPSAAADSGNGPGGPSAGDAPGGPQGADPAAPASGGRVAVLDIDYHHGNGTQDIFYERADVLTVSIHGHPGFAYPYFSGFSDERGAGAGLGFNLNIPLPEDVDGAAHLRALEHALERIRAFGPGLLVVCLGLDTAKGDPTGSWSLSPADFEANGRAIGALRLPTLVVQEGGYRIRTLGTNARRFFLGLRQGQYGAVRPPAAKAEGRTGGVPGNGRGPARG
ncbi:MAG: histone deacetylase family protein [Desulfovibrionaceae bacterium]|nr:histone deacetylase family protein [Desulfovibrionaceae bacterium]